MTPQRVRIVGAGIAGLACAEGLAQRGHDVVLFDKGRGPGGRMSTRRLQTPQGLAYFDHGAQYFTVRDADFQSQVSVWIAEGAVMNWPAAGTDAHVGVPAMNTPIKKLAERHAVHWSKRVTALERRSGGWSLGFADGGDVDVDLAVIAIPAEQAADLLGDVAPDLASQARAAVSEPCWTAMLAFAEPLAVEQDCWPADEIVGWAARNSAKPGRTGPESWVVQATAGWSRRHIDTDPDQVAVDLSDALSGHLGIELPPAIGTCAHLWRFARCAQSAAPSAHDGFDGNLRLGVCGDWLIGPRVEAAWLSGKRLADCIGSQLQG